VSAGVEIILLVSGFLLITVVSQLLAARVRKFFSKKIAAGTFLLIGLVGVYYLVDCYFFSLNNRLHLYCLFWLLVIIVQFWFFYRTIRKHIIANSDLEHGKSKTGITSV